MGAGYLVRRTGASIALGIGAAVVPVVMGDIITFLVGRHLLSWLLGTRLGRRVLNPKRREQAEEIVRDHPWLAIVAGRFLIQMRGPVYLAIGETGGPVLRFTAIDLPVAIVDVGSTFFVGYWFGAEQAMADRLRALFLLVALAAIAVIVVPTLLRRSLRHHAR